MLKIIPRIPFHYLGRYSNSVWVLPVSLAFSVTYKCNFRCRTCNIWKISHSDNELNLSQIEKTFHSIGRSLRWITLDGGEPFLREDLADVCEVIYKSCKPSIINIPSNGSLPDKTLSDVKKILKLCPNTNLIINLSLDHIGEEHDKIRGSNGAFSSLLETYNGLKTIMHPLLRVGINTVISQYNIKDWEIIDSFVKRLRPDSHLFEIAQIRDEFKNRDDTHIVPSEEDSILFLRKLIGLMKVNRKTIIGKSLHSIRKNYYSFIEKNIVFEREYVHCFSGISSCYILPDGKVWSCCNNSWLLGDLTEHNFNFRNLWHGKSAGHIRRRIKNNRCSCKQANANYLNLFHNPVYFLRIIHDVVF